MLIDCMFQELAPARAMIERLRKRDLFAFSGEVILSGDRRAQLSLSGGGATDKIKRELVALMEERSSGGAAASTYSAHSSSAESKSTERAATPLPTPPPLPLPQQSVGAQDIFCEIVKISYGKGSKNPVSGPTAFYEPKKQATDCSDDGMEGMAVLTAAQQGSAERLRQEQEMREQNRCWNVGVVPQGELGP